MPGFDGTGPRGTGPMTGGGRGFCAVPLQSNWSMYMGRTAPAPNNVAWGVPYYGARPFISQMTREQELDYLKAQTQIMREQLKGLETQIERLGEKT